MADKMKPGFYIREFSTNDKEYHYTPIGFNTVVVIDNEKEIEITREKDGSITVRSVPGTIVIHPNVANSICISVEDY